MSSGFWLRQEGHGPPPDPVTIQDTDYIGID